MTSAGEAECGHCGHRFRTGQDGTTPGPDPLHRTRQFTLSPLPQRDAPIPIVPVALKPPRRRGLLPLAGTALAFVAALALLAVFHPSFHHAAVPSPIGTWQGALSGPASGGAMLTFVFREGGGGSFGWRESGTARPLSGQSPLRWRRDPVGLLALTIRPPAAPDAVSDTMILLLNRQAWPWHVDRAHGRMTLGRLALRGG